MTAEKFHDALTLLPADLVAETDRKRCVKPKVLHWKPYAAAAACLGLILAGGFLTSFLPVPGRNAKSAPAQAAVMQAADEEAYAIKEYAAAEKAPAESPTAAAGTLEEAQSALPTAPATEAGTADSTAANSAITSDSSAKRESLYEGITLLQRLEAIPEATTACYSSAPAPRLFRTRAELEAYREHTPKPFRMDPVLEVCESYDDAWFETHDLLLATLCGVPASETPEIVEVRHYEGTWRLLREDYSASTEAERRDWHILLAVEEGLIGSAENVVLSTVIPASALTTRRVDTPKYTDQYPYPDSFLVSSRDELDAYFEEHTAQYDLASLKDACTAYDEEWFERHDLLIDIVCDASTESAWTLTDITEGADGWDWEVMISDNGIYQESYPEADLHLLTELPKGLIAPEDKICSIMDGTEAASGK